jgi:hypothetical protein
MHVLLLDPQYWFDFTPLGHTVSAIPLTEYETPLERILERLSSPPDCIIQQEQLGVRHFLTGLERAPCPTLYLAFDAHLNLYWQRYYARLFDAALTPHLSLFEALPPESRHPRVFRLLPPGTDLPWNGHAGRQHALGFCGRITPARPLRKAMTDLLGSRFGLATRQDIPPEEMFRFYRDTRIIPNEAICFEVNMRLFEGASAGAAVLTPDCGPDQRAAFGEGREMLLYRDGPDLCEKASWLLNNPAKAETMGKNAWERVQREHLPGNRAALVRDILPSLSQARATGRDAAILTWLTRLERAKAGDRRHPVSRLLSQSDSLPDSPEVLTGILHLLGSPSRKASALEFCRMLLNAGAATASLPCAAAASACALAHGDLPLARSFHARQLPFAPPPRLPPPRSAAPGPTRCAMPGARCAPASPSGPRPGISRPARSNFWPLPNTFVRRSGKPSPLKRPPFSNPSPPMPTTASRSSNPCRPPAKTRTNSHTSSSSAVALARMMRRAKKSRGKTASPADAMPHALVAGWRAHSIQTSAICRPASFRRWEKKRELSE